MKKTFVKSFKVFLFLFIGLLSKSFGQITVSLPVDRTVLQRNSSNQATVYIAGTYSQYIDRVEARFNVLNGGNGVGWQTIQNNPQGGVFNGSMVITGGWYSLEVRGMLGTTQISISNVPHVGVGEVFFIAGQSNAQGIGTTSTGIDAIDDRVNSVNYIAPCPTFPCQIYDPPFPSFTKIEGNINLSMTGNNKWCWGKLGDMLTAQTNVPVVFFNVAGGGSSVANWSQSAQGLPAPNFYIGGQWAGNVSFPYINLRKVLNHYGSYLGARAVLWHQGETETFREYNGSGISSTQYKDSLNLVITRSREHFNKTIAWVVARASFLTMNGNGVTSSNVINGQNNTVNANNKVFYGPETDWIQPRSDGVHMDTQLSTLASEWLLYLNSNFLNDAIPQTANSPVTVSVTCPNNGNNLTLTASSGFNQYFWVNGNGDISNSFSNNQSVTVLPGSYRVYAKDSHENVVFSQLVEVPSNPYPSTPTISVSGVLCGSGQTVTLTSSASYNNLWSTGATSQSIGVTATGNYSVIAKSIWGCTATSNTVTINPAISVSASSSTIYAGQPVTLTATGCASTVNWNNSAGTGSSVVVMPSTTTTFTATCTSTGCTKSVQVSVLPCPNSLTISTPLTNTTLTTTFKAIDSIDATNSVSGNVSIEYKASQSIVLNPGFSVAAGTVFKAYIGGCP